MSKAAKLLQKVLLARSDANLAFEDLCFLLERTGFSRRPGRGSHAIFAREGIPEIVNVQPLGSKAKPYQVKQVRELIVRYKLEIE